MTMMEEEKVNRKVLASLLVIAVVAGLVGASTFAYFSSTATSTGNEFVSGTLILELFGGGSGNSIWITPENDWAPGEEVAGTLGMRNAGTVDGAWLGIKPTNLSSDCMVVDADGKMFADRIEISEFALEDLDSAKYIGNIADFMATWGAWGTTAPLTLAEFASGDYWFYTEPDPVDWDLVAGGAGTELDMTFYFDEEAGNAHQNLSCSFELTVKLGQYNQPMAPDFVHMGEAGGCGYGYGSAE